MPELLRPDLLVHVVSAALDRPDLRAADLRDVALTDSPHRVDNMTTAGLHEVRGTLADGTTWRAFAKVLHPASESPLMQYVPEEHHESVLRNLDWLDEPRVYRSPLGTDLPEGIRTPRLLAVDEQDDRIVLWLEQVDASTEWQLDDYRRAALALGAMAGRWPEDRVTAELGLGRRDLGYLFFGKVANVDLPVLADEAHWRSPAVAAAVDPEFRTRLEAMIARLPGRIAAADALPHSMSHGDATPHNLLHTADGIVAVDWSYGSSGPVGADLAQLLAGRFDTGEAPADEATAVSSVVLDAYLEGLATEGVHPDRRDVSAAWATHLAVRSVVSSTVVEHRPDLDDEALASLIERRVAVARIGLELEAGV